MVVYRTRDGKSLERGGRRAIEAGAEVGGGGIGEAPCFATNGCASAPDESWGPEGQGELKKESFSDFFDVGAGANSMRGVSSVSEAELDDVVAAGADSGTGGSGGVDENGDAKKA